MKLVALFRDYRDLEAKMHTAELDAVRNKFELEKLADLVVRLQEDNKSLADSLDKARQAIDSNPSYINNVMDLLQKYQEQVLQEQPLQPDQQPEWLTPGDDR